MSYLKLDEFRELTSLPAEYVDAVEQVAPGFTERQLSLKSRWIDARLRKRYRDLPFQEPIPEEVRDWLTRLVSLLVLHRRGVDPLDAQYQWHAGDAEKAEAEILEAANSEVGLVEVTAGGGSSASGATKGGPFGYSEQSPYVAFDLQSRVGRAEDRDGGGTYG